MFKQKFNFKEQLQNLRDIRYLAMGGMFIALYTVLSFFNIRITDNIEIRFAFLALAAAGMYGGPLFGAFVGAASDILSMLMTAGQGSSFFFGFTITYALMGFCFGLVLYKAKLTIPRVVTASLCEFLISVFVSTIWLYMMYGTPYLVLFTTRLIKCAILFIPNCLILYFALQAFQRAFHHLRLHSHF